VSVNFENKLDCFMHIIVTAGGKSVDATQELIAIGICNIGNSFVQAYPVSGALSRGAVQNASGGRTPLAGLYTGMFTTVPGYHKVFEIQLC
jgi:MFS superfamily sulfate permease-like transporter